MMTRPKSRGWIQLRSRNPFDKPLLEAGYFNHPHDMKVIREGLKFCISLTKIKAFRKFGARLWERRKMPGCEHLRLLGDDYLECMVRQYTQTSWHMSGTARMGPRSDPGAVLDHRLRVHGVEALRVVDTSVMPTIVSGNTNAPAIMIAERASDLIKQVWGILNI